MLLLLFRPSPCAHFISALSHVHSNLPTVSRPLFTYSGPVCVRVCRCVGHRGAVPQRAAPHWIRAPRRSATPNTRPAHQTCSELRLFSSVLAQNKQRQTRKRRKSAPRSLLKIYTHPTHPDVTCVCVCLCAYGFLHR